LVTGTVDKWLTSYGFVKGDDGNQYFIHISALPEGTESLNQGQKVEFDSEQGPKGLKAVNVKLSSESAAPAEDASAEEETATEEATQTEEEATEE